MKTLNKYFIGILVMFVFLLIGANIANADDPITGEVTITIDPVAPTVTTTTVSPIAQTTATSGGNVTSDGGAAVTARGVVWSTSSNPTIANSKTSDGTGIGSFTSSLTSLTPGTPYYVRAYATNSVGTSYGNEVSFTTASASCSSPCGTIASGSTCTAYTTSTVNYPSSCVSQIRTCTNGTLSGTYTNASCSVTSVAPTVSTTAASSITQTTATSGGNVTSDGGAAVTARGVVWSTSSNPTIANSKTSDGTGIGSFTSSLTSLTAGTLYHVRAYATNSVGTSYGGDLTFTTLAATCTPPLTQTVTVSCDLKNGVAAISGLVTRSQTKSSYPGCTFGTPVTVSNSTYSSDNCVYPVPPTVTTATVTSITPKTATSGGNVTSDGGSAVTARGVVVNEESPNPSISSYDSIFPSGSGTGSFTVNLTGLGAGTLYHIRAYATNSVDTSYGADVTFTTAAPMSGTLTPKISPCIITTTGSSCSMDLDWKITNPEKNPTAITTYGNADSIVTTATAIGTYTGTKSFYLSPANSPKTFYLYNNEQELDAVEVSGQCDTVHNYVWNPGTNSCALKTYTVTATAGTGGTISPASKVVSHGLTTTFEVVPNTGYSIVSINTNCGSGGYISGDTTYITPAITSNCTVTAWFTINSYGLTVTKSGTGGGTVSDGTYINCGSSCYHPYDYNTSVILTATPDSTSIFKTWTGCDGVTDGKCSVTMSSAKSVQVVFTKATVSVTASPTTYNVAPSANVPVTYTVTTSGGTTSCRLVDYNKADISGYDWKASSPISLTAPSTALQTGYGYYVKCKSNENANILPVYSSLITVYVVQPSISSVSTNAVLVTADPISYNTTPGATVAFAYTASTVPSNIPVSDPKLECKLVDYLGNDLSPASAYQTTSPISYIIPNLAPVHSYGYYVMCRNKTVTTATATSSKITINTSCGTGVWDPVQAKCMMPTVDNFTVSDCTIKQNESTCPSKLAWSISNPNGPTEVTTPDHISVGTGNPGVATHYITYNQAGTPFYLYHNNVEPQPPLATRTAMATCTSGTGWSDTYNACVKPVGTLLSAPCPIQIGDSSCSNATLSWSIENPLGNSIVNASYGTTPIVSSPNASGDATYSLNWNQTKTLSLYSGIYPIQDLSVTAQCISGSHWDVTTSKCLINAVDTTNFNASPNPIFKGKTSTLSWNATLATSCTLKNVNTGTFINIGNKTNSADVVPQSLLVVNPESNTAYELSCWNSTPPTKTDSKTVKVVNITVKEN